MKQMLYSTLAQFTKRIVQKYKPDVIAVTGSVGKTTTKDAVRFLLDDDIRASAKNYNNELGVPLTVIGSEAPGRSPVKWVKLLLKGFALAHLGGEYSDKLLLEYGIDRPGDMDYLMDLIHPHLMIVQQIGDIPVHVEFFKDRDELVAEKGKSVARLTEHDMAFLNFDDEDVRAMGKQAKAEVVTYGFQDGADIRATDIRRLGSDDSYGITFKVQRGGNSVPVKLPHVISKHHIYAVLAAFAVGLHYGMNLITISEKLRDFRPPKGRMNVIKGIKHTTVIDDTYNASPHATIEALSVMEDFAGDRRKVVVLGDMSELGTFTEDAHRRVGQKVAAVADLFIAVGLKMKFATEEARRNGLDASMIHEFATSGDAGPFVDDIIKKGDVVLVKGSQSMRMELVAKEIIAEPLRASELLVRQEPEWQRV
jgi:UDP-N-acetylmuramyl pentapeptide synthase